MELQRVPSISSIRQTLAAITRQISGSDNADTNGKRNKDDAKCGQMQLEKARERKLSFSDGSLSSLDYRKLLMTKNAREEKYNEDSTPTIRNNSYPIFSSKKKLKSGGTTPTSPDQMSPSSSFSKKKRFFSKIRSHEKQNYSGDNSYILRCAVRRSDEDQILQIVSRAQTNIDGADNKGVTALHEASFDGNMNCVKLLISYGACINTQDIQGLTALDYAVCGGHFECAAYLIAQGATDDRIKDGQIVYRLLRKDSRKDTARRSTFY